MAQYVMHFVQNARLANTRELIRGRQKKKFTGAIRALNPLRCFVDLGTGIDGMVHMSEAYMAPHSPSI